MNKRDWICTDTDMLQFCLKENDFSYFFTETRDVISGYAVCFASVDLTDYTLDELWSYCSGYYSSFEKIVRIYGFKDAFRIIAECVFEQTKIDEMEYVFSKSSLKEAEEFVSKCIRDNDYLKTVL